MKLAVAVETAKHPEKAQDYKVWYLELNKTNDVVGIGVKSREELVKELFEQYKQKGKSSWRAFLKDAINSTPIEAHDFIAKNSMENTHFGNLPTLSEFQATLDTLQLNLEVRSLAS